MKDNSANNTQARNKPIILEYKKALRANAKLKKQKAVILPVWAIVRNKKELSRNGNRTLETNNEICWDLKKETRFPVADYSELIGPNCGAVISYLIDKKYTLSLNINANFPNLRLPYDGSNAYFSYNFTGMSSQVSVSETFQKGKLTQKRTVDLIEYVTKIVEKNRLSFFFETNKPNVFVERTFTTLSLYQGIVERVKVINNTSDVLECTVIAKKKIAAGKYTAIRAHCPDGIFNEADDMVSTFNIEPKTYKCAYVVYTAYLEDFKACNVKLEFEERRSQYRKNFSVAKAPTLVFDDNNLTEQQKSINRKMEVMFKFSLDRVETSYTLTPLGKLPAEGGGAYGDVSVKHCFLYSAPVLSYINSENTKELMTNASSLYFNYLPETPVCCKSHALPYTISGFSKTGISPYGDCGNTEMFALGFTKYLLLSGSSTTARRYYSYLKRSAALIINKMTDKGIVRSDCDDIEGLIPSGNANILTNSYAYEFLSLMSILSYELDFKEDCKNYTALTEKLKAAIIKHFSAKIKGYAVFAHYKGCKELRSSCAEPIIAGINENISGTAKLLSSEELLYVDSALVSNKYLESRDSMLLENATALFLLNQADTAAKLLEKLTANRLLGNHAPYCYEAYPHNDRRQTVGESALYFRVFIEGLFGLRLKGFERFSVNPHLPSNWGRVKLSNIFVCGRKLSFEADKPSNKFTIYCEGQEVFYGDMDDKEKIIDLKVEL